MVKYMFCMHLVYMMLANSCNYLEYMAIEWLSLEKDAFCKQKWSLWYLAISSKTNTDPLRYIHTIKIT